MFHFPIATMPSKLSDFGHYLLLAIFIAAFWAVISFSISIGEDRVQVQWDREKAATAKKVKDLQDRLDLAESTHQEATAKNTHDLAQAQKDHDVAMAAARADAADRLRQSAVRADVYRRQAEGDAAQCRALASHAAGLDRALEAGRELVRELREALGLRDRQLIALGEQIRNDRDLANAVDGR